MRRTLCLFAPLLLAAGCSKESFNTVALDLSIWAGDEVVNGFVGDRVTVDGWEIHFESWISYFGDVQVGEAGTGADSYYAIDWVRAEAPVELGTYELAVGAYDLGFKTLPASADAEPLTEVDEASVLCMIDERWSHYIVGQASQAGLIVSFRWGFENPADYSLCIDGATGQAGLVVTQEQIDAQERVAAQVTFHPDHLFFDWLETEAADMRFNVFSAWANTDDDYIEWGRLGDINAAAILDPYDEEMLDEEGSPLSYSNAAIGMDSYIIYNVRGGWHWNGQGLCEIDDPPPER